MNNTYRVNVALGGDLRHVVIREGVTVPEIEILRHIHSESVTNICLTGKQEYDSGSERTRLTTRYGDKVVNVFGVYGDLPVEINSLNLPPSILEPGAEPIGTFPKGKKKTEPEPETESV